jgi:hypothetical protein
MVDIATLLSLQARSRRNALVAARRLHRNRADADEAARAVLSARPAVGTQPPTFRPPGRGFS